MGDHDSIEHRLECGQDAADVLIAHHADHADQESEIELLSQRLGQRRRARRVVRGVDEYRWRTPHPLQPAGTARGGESGPYGVDVELTLRTGTEERLDGSQRDRGVVRLMFAVQREKDFGVHPAEALQFQHLSADCDLAAQHRELRIFARYSGISVDGLRQHNLHRLRYLTADDRHRVRCSIFGLVDDAGFLTGDAGDVVAEVLDVVDADRRDHRDRRVDHIGGVPTSAKTDLDDPHVDRGIRERCECHRGEDLELAHRRATVVLRLLVDHLYERLEFGVGRHVCRWADRLSVDRDTLDRRLQVRAGGAPGAPLQSGQQRIDHPRH